ncbi:unannotated protein [freshwater metagenome]|uniref:Unannotated protein n=1 Tax=freshwater metagenome TaxID=449393 RepID=A0A6J7K0Z1_9ZZZZ
MYPSAKWAIASPDSRQWVQWVSASSPSCPVATPKIARFRESRSPKWCRAAIAISPAVALVRPRMGASNRGPSQIASTSGSSGSKVWKSLMRKPTTRPSGASSRYAQSSDTTCQHPCG